jgi:predicted dehydrogenase
VKGSTLHIEDILKLDFPALRPLNPRRGIGIVGAGSIVRNAHLPAYRQAEFNVVAIYDVRIEAARAMAAEFGIPAVCETLDELLGRSDVEIVDMALTPEGQFDIAMRAFAAGKHVLCQKPLSEDYGMAMKLVAAADEAGVVLAVNQQMRWSPAIRFASLLTKHGAYGELTECQFDVDLLSDWRWMGQRTRVEYFYNSIHYFDSIRMLFGEPRRVLASSASYPGQRALAETRSFTILEYDGPLRVIVLSNHNNWSDTPRASMRVHGTEGRSEGTLGMKDYPAQALDTFSFVARSTPQWTHSRRFLEPWLPTAFRYPMAELMLATEQKRQPLTSGADNANTLRLIAAAYRSIEEGRRVEISEIVS